MTSANIFSSCPSPASVSGNKHFSLSRHSQKLRKELKVTVAAAAAGLKAADVAVQGVSVHCVNRVSGEATAETVYLPMRRLQMKQRVT